MKILLIDSSEAIQHGYVVTSYGDHDGIPATVRAKILFPDAEIVDVESEYTIDYFEEQEEERLEAWRQSATVELWKLKAILDSQGLLDSVQSAVQGFPKAVQLAWEYSPDVQRLSPAVIGLAELLELTETDIDDIFTEAQNLKL